MKQKIGIPIGTDPATFWANIFLYSYEEAYMSSLISSDKVTARHFHSAEHFVDGLCTINDSGEFGRSVCYIYSQGA